MGFLRWEHVDRLLNLYRSAKSMHTCRESSTCAACISRQNIRKHLIRNHFRLAYPIRSVTTVRDQLCLAKHNPPSSPSSARQPASIYTTFVLHSLAFNLPPKPNIRLFHFFILQFQRFQSFPSLT